MWVNKIEITAGLVNIVRIQPRSPLSRPGQINNGWSTTSANGRITVASRDVTDGYILGKIGPKYDKYGTFKDNLDAKFAIPEGP